MIGGAERGPVAAGFPPLEAGGADAFGAADRAWPVRHCVLDIETAPDRHAFILSGRSRGTFGASPLHEVVNVSVLTFEEVRPEVFAGFRLASFHREEYAEPEILINVEAELDRVASGGVLITFNGLSFDLPTLRMRQMRWWLSESSAVDRIGEGLCEHVDVMLEMSSKGRARWPTLADACASVGFSLAGPSRIGRARTLPAATEKCERDVVGTAILFFYVLAARRKTRRPLGNGLPALGGFLRGPAAGGAHLERFALSELLGERAGAWGS